MKIQESRAHHQQFWKEQPALLLALSVLIGSSSTLFFPFPHLFIWPSLWTLYLTAVRKFAPIILLIGASLYSYFLYPTSSAGEQGYFSIASLSSYQSPFQKSLIYKGMLYIDKSRIPCTVHYRGKNHPKANKDYILQGQLQKRGPYDYSFKATEWKAVKKSWSLAEFRFQMKKKFKTFIASKLHRDKTAVFLSSLITGELEDRMLRFEFGKLGLQHILAISGFHFAILITFFSFFLELFMPRQWKIITLLILINGYFLFVGSLPAVQRSWLTALFYLTGKLIQRHSSGLNLLGVAMLIELILDPLISANIGFQLSFASCFGILLLFPILPSSPLDAKQLSPLFKHIALLGRFFRQGFKISFAVNIAIFPLLLIHFHQFPLIGLLYNLFFPFLVSVSLFSLLIAISIHLFIPFFSPPFFSLTDWFTREILDLTTFPPIALDYSLKISDFPAWAAPLYLFIIFCLSITYNKITKEHQTLDTKSKNISF